MKILISKNGGNAEFYVTGRIDAVTSPELEESIKQNIHETNVLTLNLKEVEYVSSAGLRVFLTAHKLLSADNKQFRIINVQPSVMDILNMTGFTNILTIE